MLAAVGQLAVHVLHRLPAAFSGTTPTWKLSNTKYRFW